MKSRDDKGRRIEQIGPRSLAFGEVTLQFVDVVPGDPACEFVPIDHLDIFVGDGTRVGRINFRVDTDVRIAAAGRHESSMRPTPAAAHRLPQSATVARGSACGTPPLNR